MVERQPDQSLPAPGRRHAPLIARLGHPSQAICPQQKVQPPCISPDMSVTTPGLAALTARVRACATSLARMAR